MRTFGWLFLAFTLTTTVELLLLLTVGKAIGTLATVTIILLTGFLGAALAGREGRRAWRRVVDSLRRGELPGDPIVQALLVLVGGVLLLTPGFLTDTVGFACLIPTTRRWLAALVQRVLARRIEGGAVFFARGPEAGPAASREPPPTAGSAAPQGVKKRKTINVTDQQ